MNFFHLSTSVTVTDWRFLCKSRQSSLFFFFFYGSFRWKTFACYDCTMNLLQKSCQCLRRWQTSLLNQFLFLYLIVSNFISFSRSFSFTSTISRFSLEIFDLSILNSARLRSSGATKQSFRLAHEWVINNVGNEAVLPVAIHRRVYKQQKTNR